MLIIENLFTKLKIDALNKAGEVFEDLKTSPNVICEDNGDIRSVYAPQLHHTLFDTFYKERELVSIAKKILKNNINPETLLNLKAVKQSSGLCLLNFLIW